MSWSAGWGSSGLEGNAVSNDIQRLIALSSPAIAIERASALTMDDLFGAREARALERILGKRNGFYAFEGALHVFANTDTANELGVKSWNASSLWKHEYRDLMGEGVCFAEDVFGNQFLLRGDEIFVFDPETGRANSMAQDIDAWAELILGDFSFWTGHAVARAWQAVNGTISRGSRLVPVTPFVLGGEFVPENVRAMDAVAGMKYRASIALQIRDLPDGATVTLRAVD